MSQLDSDKGTAERELAKLDELERKVVTLEEVKSIMDELQQIANRLTDDENGFIRLTQINEEMDKMLKSDVEGLLKQAESQLQ